jgi:hypothetical protein
MDIFSKKYKGFLILAALLALFGAVSFLGIRYLMKEMRTNNENIKKEIINQEEREKRLAEAPCLRDQFEIIEKENDKFEVILSQNQIITLIKKIEVIAEETGNEMTIENMEIKNEESEKEAVKKGGGKSKESEKELLTELTGDYASMEIKLRGSYNNALNFIEKMENMSYCADIISLQMLAEKDEAASQASGAFLSVSPFAERSSATKSRTSEIKLREETGEAIINSVLDAVVYFER